MKRVQMLLILLAIQLLMGYNLIVRINKTQQIKQQNTSVVITDDSIPYLVQSYKPIYFLKK